MKGDPAFVFPHRVEEIDVLRAAFDANRNDGRAAYYLGNALASKNRDKEALAIWRDAVRLDSTNTIAQRNFARALWITAQNKEEAAAQYQHAVETSPNDFRLYIEFDRLLAELGATDRRVKLLESAPAAVLAQSGAVQSLAGAYIDAGHFADAVRLLEKTSFTSGEGEDAALGLYRKAHLGLARKYRESGDHLKAAAEFAAVTEFPRNFGVGRPAMQSQAQYYVAAAREYDAGGQRDEADRWWKRAATEELNPPTQPEEPWSESYFFKAVALEHVHAFKQMEAFVGLAKKAGAKIVVGSHSDVPHSKRGWAYQRELELLVDSGLTPMEAIVAGTIENARYFHIDDRLGSVEPGKIADLLLVEGDPLKDISNMRRVKRVMLNGKLQKAESESK